MFQENILLSKVTTFKIGGPAKYYYQAKNEEGLIKALKKIKEINLPYYILGKGSNVLFPDKGFPGLVIQISNQEIETKNNKIICSAGLSLNKLAQEARNNNLTGLEWALLVPGTVGGAVYINAAAFGYYMSDIIEKVKVLDIKTLEIKTLKKEELKFSAKKSLFQKKKNLIILNVELKLKKGNKKDILKKEKEYSLHRKSRQPLNYPSVGCIFKNPKNNSASYLIDQAGLKGKIIGGAQISEKHANFIINIKEAKAKDVLKLIKIIKETVNKKFNIKLEEEVQIII